MNPRHLAPALRDSVCEQCHLQGADRFLRAGRTEGDFRPGLPLDEFVAVFVEAGPAGRPRAVGHVEQMHASRCYAASGGALGCTSCHDPHRRPRDRRAGRALPRAPPRLPRRKRLPRPGARPPRAPGRRQLRPLPHAPARDPRRRSYGDDGSPHPALADRGGGFRRAARHGGRADPVERFWPLRAGGPTCAEADRDLGIALFHVAR